MKAQMIYHPSLESAIIGAVLKQATDPEGNPLEVTFTEGDRQNLIAQIDETAPILIIAGMVITDKEDYAITEYLNSFGNVPFVDFYVIGSLVKVGHIAGVTIIRPYTEGVSTISMVYDAFLESRSMLRLSKEKNLDVLVDLVTQYYLYNFRDNTTYYLSLGLLHMYNALGMNIHKYTKDIKEQGDLLQSELFKDIMTTGFAKQESYVQRQATTVKWEMALYNGEYITLGVVNGHTYKNELAHYLMKFSHTPKTIIVVLEEKDRTAMTIRTNEVNAVSVAKLVYDYADGKANATTVYTKLHNTTTDVANAFKNAIEGGATL